MLLPSALATVSVGDTVYEAYTSVHYQTVGIREYTVTRVTPKGLWITPPLGFDTLRPYYQHPDTLPNPRNGTWLPFNTHRVASTKADACVSLLHRRVHYIRHAADRLNKARLLMQKACTLARSEGVAEEDVLYMEKAARSMQAGSRPRSVWEDH